APGEETGLIALLQLITARLATPVVAAGGIATGRAIAAVLCLGARAAALGTAFLDCPEAATAPVHRSALHDDAPTRLTRALSGRTARGVENGFLRAPSESAPAASPGNQRFCVLPGGRPQLASAVLGRSLARLA